MADKAQNIRTRLSIDGEKQYKEACSSINKSLSLLNSEMKLVTAEYKNNADSTEALKAKQDILQRTYEEQAKKVAETEKQLERCRDIYGENSDAVLKYQKELNYQKTALQNTTNALKENEKIQKEAVSAQRQYENSCKDIDQNLSLLRAELQEVNAKYKDNENSAKALAEKQDLLKKAYAEQERKVNETETAYKSIADQYGKTSKEAKQLEEQLHKEKAALYEVDNQIKDTEVSHSKFSATLGGLGGAMATGVKAIGTAAAAIGTAVVAGLGYAVSQADEAKGALNDFCAATGTATDEADQYKQVMENIYNGNYGEGFKDIAAAMTTVKQQAGDLGADELEKMTTNALALRDTFDMDVAESTRAATQLMQKFGLSGEEAYNLIAQGAQQGLNQNGDLLDVINEYSNQYSQAGLSAEDMFNSIKNGAETGVWSIDKMGDAFKEFSIRMNDGTANEYLTSLGLNADELVSKFQTGGESAKEAMGEISSALKNCDDESLQYTAGVGLMGTMWEDMGADACTALMDVEGQISRTTDAMGQINAVKYDTFGEAIKGAGRILQTSFIMPIGEQALPIFSDFANEISRGAAEAGGDIGKFADSFGTAIKNLTSGLTELIPQIADFAVEMVSGLAQGIVENAPTIVQAGVDIIKSLADGIIEAIPTLTESAVEIVTTLLDGIIEMIPSLADGAVQIIAGLATGIGQALPQLVPSIIDAVLTIVETLVNNIPMLVEAALQLVSGLADGIVAALPVLIERLPEIITAIINALVEGLPMIMENAADIVIALVDGIINAIPLLIEAIPQIIVAIVTGLVNGLPQIVAAAGQLVLAIITKLAELPGQIASAIADGITRIAEWGANMQAKASEVMNGMLTGIVNIVTQTPQKIWNCIVGAVTQVATWGANMQAKAREVMNTMLTNIVSIVTQVPQKIYNSISGAISKVAQWGTEVKNKAVEGMNMVLNGITGVFSNIGSTFADIGSNIVSGIWNGISSGWDWLKNKVSNLANSLLDAAKDALGIESPSKRFRDEVGVYMAQGIGVGFEKEMPAIAKRIEKAIPTEFDIGTKVNVGSNAVYDTRGNRRAYGSGALAGGFTVIQNIYANTTDYAKQQKEAARQFRMIARTVG